MTVLLSRVLLRTARFAPKSKSHNVVIAFNIIAPQRYPTYNQPLPSSLPSPSLLRVKIPGVAAGMEAN